MLEREHPRIQLASANLQHLFVNLHLLVESAVNCLYISNAKLINLWETAVSLFIFLALLVEFSSDGGFSPPNPSVFSGIRLFILIYQKIAVLC